MRHPLPLLLALLGFASLKAEIVRPLPPGSGDFGGSVTVLSNGNFVIVDPFYDAPESSADVGAVYLFDGETHQVISTLTGTTSGDQVGSGGIVVLHGGNYLICSPQWANGSAQAAGAVTWCSAESGRQGQVSAANSLVGSRSFDHVGIPQETDGKPNIVVLTSGNYVISSPHWANPDGIHNQPADFAGAVTWGDRDKGVSGLISSANSLVGYISGHQVGSSGKFPYDQHTGVVALPDGNYVVCSPGWAQNDDFDLGAVTWCRGDRPTTGLVTETNSLIGINSGNSIGSAGITILSTEHYVVCSPLWEADSDSHDRGAVTWCNKNGSTKGKVSSSNSLVGASDNDIIGGLHRSVPGLFNGVFALANGNYVVCSPSWDKGAVENTGAVTLCQAEGGTKGTVSTLNSLTGSSEDDEVGSDGVTLLKNGNPNYVIGSSNWANGDLSGAGAATWMTPTTPTAGTVTPANSIVGSSIGDWVGINVVPLANGHYVLSNPNWDNGGVEDAGAVTWCDGTVASTGTITAANSIVGTDDEDLVGGYLMSGDRAFNNVTPLPNGHYVICSPYWSYHDGAVTWGNGLGGTAGEVSALNSLIGEDDSIPLPGLGSGGITILTNNNFVVSSPFLLDGDGAVAWCSGTGGTVGVVSSANALVGNFRTGDGGVIALSNGNYVVASPSWTNGGVFNAGAVTWCDGATGRTGMITAQNSMVGTAEDDLLGYEGLLALPGGKYAFYSSSWNNGAVAEAGSVTLLDGAQQASGPVTTANSLLGKIAGAGFSWELAYDPLNAQLIVLRPDTQDVAILVDKPEIDLQQPAGVPLASGGQRDFGIVAVGESSSFEFTAANLGTQSLTGISATLAGPNADQFSVVMAEVPSSLGGGGSFVFHASFAPTLAGRKQAVLQLSSNDADEPLYTVTLLGGPAADIAVFDSGAPSAPDELTNGIDTLDFGDFANATQSPPRIITVRNEGTVPLANLTVSINGGSAAQFILDTSSLSGTLAPGAETTFAVSFKPLSLGSKLAMLHILSADEDEPSFDVILTGRSVAKVLPIVKGGTVTDLSHNAATLGGAVDPKGSVRSIFLEYGLTTGYGASVTATPSVSGVSVTAVSATLAGLQPHTKYHARFRADGPLGAAVGPDIVFTTNNRTPTAAGDALTILPGATYLLPLLANDTDPDGDTLSVNTFSALSQVTAGKLTKSGGSLLFTAAATFTGASFSYSVKDGFGGSSGSVTVNLDPGSCSIDPPSVSPPSAGVTYPITVTAAGAWSVSESLSWLSADPASGVGNSTVIITLQPNTAKTARTGVVRIGGETHQVTQDGVISPSLSTPPLIPPAIVAGDYSLLIPTTHFPVTYTVTQMPPGLKIDGNSGFISGKPTKAGKYEMTVKARNAAGAAPEVLGFTITVAELKAGMVGSFHGLIDAHPLLNADLGSRLELVTTNSGSFSGKLITGITNTVLKGVLDTDPAAPNEAHATLTLPRKNASPLLLHLDFSHDAQSILGSVEDDGAETTPVRAWRNSWSRSNRATAFAGLYTFVIPSPDPAPSLPQGSGFGSLKLSSDTTGAFSVSGKLADGSTFTTSSFFGPNGQILIYQSLYGNRGSLSGLLGITLAGNPEDHVLGSELQWYKPATPSSSPDTGYRDGFGPMTVNAMGALLPTLSAGGLIMAEDALIDFEAGGLETTAQEFSQPLIIRNPSPAGRTNKAVFETTTSANSNKVAMPTFNAATGAFAGSFVVPGPSPSQNRPATYQGILVRSSGSVSGHGFFLLPLSTAPKALKNSGRAYLHPAAP